MAEGHSWEPPAEVEARIYLEAQKRCTCRDPNAPTDCPVHRVMGGIRDSCWKLWDSKVIAIDREARLVLGPQAELRRRRWEDRMKPWVGVDLDGTLAEYHGWKGPEHIGPPIPAMVERVKAWLEEGLEVRIFTARACIPEQVPPVIEWCKVHLGRELIVTNIKDSDMVNLWDDRCHPVQPNTGLDILGRIAEMEEHFKDAARREDELVSLLAAVTHRYEQDCEGEGALPGSGFPSYAAIKALLGEPVEPPAPLDLATMPVVHMESLITLDPDPVARFAARPVCPDSGLRFTWLSDPLKKEE